MFRKVFLAALASYLALGLISSGLAADQVRFGTAQKINPLHVLPVLAATEKGIWKENGLEVQWTPFDAGAILDRAVAAGQIDMGWSAAPSLVLAVTHRLPMVVVADTQGVEKYILLVSKDSPIKEPKDLKGARIGVTRMGSTTHAFAQAIAKSLGIEKEMRIVATGGTAQNWAALRGGAIDGLISTNFASAKFQFEGVGRVLVSVRNYLPKEWPDLLIFARKDFADRNPEVARRMIRALLQGTDFVSKNPDWAVQKMKEISGYPEELGRVMHKELHYVKDGRINRKGLENVVNFMVEYGLIPKEKAPAVEAIYTNKFVE